MPLSFAAITSPTLGLEFRYIFCLHILIILLSACKFAKGTQKLLLLAAQILSQGPLTLAIFAAISHAEIVCIAAKIAAKVASVNGPLQQL